MSLYLIKLIGCAAMLIDHIGYCFIPMDSPFYMLTRIIGRMALPIFCFTIVEGFVHTSNLKRYILRIGLLALVSEIPFDIMNGLLSFGSEGIIYEYMFLMQNVGFTLLIGLVAISVMDIVKEKYMSSPAIYNTLGVIVIIGFSLLAEVIRSDYTSLGVLCIMILYFFRGKQVPIIICMIVWCMFYATGGSYVQFASLLALIPIFMYTGEKGKDMKLFFYLFYPVHMMVISMFTAF